MDNKQSSRTLNYLILIVAIVITVLALLAYPYIPEKHLLIAPSDGQHNLYSTQLNNGKQAASWLDKQRLSFRCSYPEDLIDSQYYCSINHNLARSETKGADLSVFNRIKIKVHYQGTAPKLRFFARSFDPRFSTIDDPNSTKYNTIFLPSVDLDQEMTIDMKEFVVAEWWLLMYKIPRRYAAPDLSNVIGVGIDFSYPMTGGDHDVTVERIEFIGERIAKDKWYLGLFSIWLAGVFIYSLNQLRRLKQKTQKDTKLIDNLHQDNERLQQETSKFRRLSTVDPLTQLFNRFGIDQVVNSLTNSAQDGSMGPIPQMTLILIDIDYFKNINDTHGHDVGDVVLKEIAEIIKHNTPKSGFIGRWGGEEFLILLPASTLEQARLLAETLRRKIAQNKIVTPDQDQFTVTASFGVGECTDCDFPSTFREVDQALYDAKHRGRNQVSVADASTRAKPRQP